MPHCTHSADVPCGELLVTLSAGVRTVSEVQVHVFDEDVFVAESPEADVALVRLLTCKTTTCTSAQLNNTDTANMQESIAAPYRRA